MRLSTGLFSAKQLRARGAAAAAPPPADSAVF